MKNSSALECYYELYLDILDRQSQCLCSEPHSHIDTAIPLNSRLDLQYKSGKVFKHVGHGKTGRSIVLPGNSGTK